MGQYYPDVFTGRLQINILILYECRCKLLGEISWRRKLQPPPVFLPGKLRGRGAWQAAVPGVTEESEVAERSYTKLV